MRKRFLDIIFDDYTPEERKRKMGNWLEEKNQRSIVTPGPEFVVRAWKESLFKEIINLSDFSLCDGIGIRLFAWLDGKYIRYRMTGVDMLYELASIAVRGNKKMFLLGGEGGIATRAALQLKKQFPELYVDAGDGPRIEETTHQLQLVYHPASAENALIDRVNKATPDILAVGFGPVKQEKWIHANLHRCPSVKIAIGVGGALDIIGGKFKRAPAWLRAMGGEWLWRLLLQPYRWKRVLLSTVGFLILICLVHLNKIKPKRRNVLAVIVNDDNKFLLINNRYLASSAGGEAHWQFVQGGIDAGETAKEALMRELHEETGTDKYSILRKSNIFDYAYPGTLHSSYSTKIFAIFYVRFTGRASDVKPTDEASDFRWVSADALVHALNPTRQGIASRILRELQTKEFQGILQNV